jgi:hypothetical protein
MNGYRTPLETIMDAVDEYASAQSAAQTAEYAAASCQTSSDYDRAREARGKVCDCREVLEEIVRKVLGGIRAQKG